MVLIHRRRGLARRRRNPACGVRSETLGGPRGIVGGHVRDALAPKYEAALTREGGTYRPWRTLVLANIERAYQMVS